MMSQRRSDILRQARAVAATWSMSEAAQRLLRAEAPYLADDLDDLRDLLASSPVRPIADLVDGG